jgi:hypothetical protein
MYFMNGMLYFVQSRLVNDADKFQRSADKKDVLILMKKLGSGEVGGLYAQEDYENPAWEDD